MKTIKYIFLVLLIIPLLSSCDEDKDEDEEPNRSLVTVTLQNSSGAIGCSATVETITFIVSYRDIQVDATINPGTFGVINVLVEDGESINVKVQKTSDNTVLANANVDVYFSGSGVAKVTYCDPFDLIFTNF